MLTVRCVWHLDNDAKGQKEAKVLSDLRKSPEVPTGLHSTI